jgi:hypothetical protein
MAHCRAALAKGIIKQQHIDQTQRYYEKYGGKTVVLARCASGGRGGGRVARQARSPTCVWLDGAGGADWGGVGG